MQRVLPLPAGGPRGGGGGGRAAFMGRRTPNPGTPRGSDLRPTERAPPRPGLPCGWRRMKPRQAVEPHDLRWAGDAASGALFSPGSDPRPARGPAAQTGPSDCPGAGPRPRTSSGKRPRSARHGRWALESGPRLHRGPLLRGLRKPGGPRP